MELDFLSDPEVDISFRYFFFLPSCAFESISDDVLSVTWWFQDIRSSGETKKIGTLKAWKEINEQHIAHQYQYSLRVSQLYRINTWIKCIRKQFFLSIVSSCSTGILVHLVLAVTRKFQHNITRASCWASYYCQWSQIPRIHLVQTSMWWMCGGCIKFLSTPFFSVYSLGLCQKYVHFRS